MENDNEDTSLPMSLQAKLFDYTGTKGGNNKGFLCFYVNQHGDVVTLQKTENGAIALALQKAMEVRCSEEGSFLTEQPNQ